MAVTVADCRFVPADLSAGIGSADMMDALQIR